MYVNYTATRNIITSHIQVELVSNGDFSAGATGWTATDWTVTTLATHNTGNTTPLKQALPTVTGYSCTVIVTTSGRTAGAVTPWIGVTAGSAIATNTTATEVITSVSTTELAFVPTSDFDGAVDDISSIVTDVWDLEFNAIAAPRNPTTNKIEVMSLDETTQTIVINSSGMMYSVTTELVTYGGAVWLQFMEFFNSVREGESFFFDWRGTVASPDNLETVKMVGTYTETYVDADLYRFSFTVRVQ